MEKVDFVLTWVDGNDEEWQKVRAQYTGEPAGGGASRYRDWENLQYWFRGVEKFAPWVNHIYFVTCGQVPKWLNTANPKLTVVCHEEFMSKEYLPTFSSHPIELNLHRIKGLSERFVYFNDDTFLIAPVEPEFFFKDGLPCDCCLETVIAQDNADDPFAHILLNNSALINMHFQKREVIQRTWKKWFHRAYGKMVLRNLLMLPYQEFSGFKYTHMPSPFLKSSYEHVWEAEGERLDRLCRNRFRTAFDVNQYLIKNWQCMEGNYMPQSPKAGYFCIMGRNEQTLYDIMEKQSRKMVCINDSEEVRDFENMKAEVIRLFEKILPEKSSFEV